MPTKITLAKSIRFHREAVGLSQKEAAKAAGIRQGTWSDLEQGKANPRLSTLEVISYTLGIDVKTLFFYE